MSERFGVTGFGCVQAVELRSVQLVMEVAVERQTGEVVADFAERGPMP